MLAERIERAVHIESDCFFRFIARGYVDPWRPEAHDQNTTVMRIVGKAAVQYAQAGYWTIIDGIVLPGWFFEPLRDSIGASGFDVAYAVLRPPRAVAVERAANRRSSALSERRVVEQLWDTFSDLGALEHHAIDVTERFSAEQTAELVRERLEAGELSTEARHA